VKGETRSSAPHTLQYIGDQVPLCAPRVPKVEEQECGPTRDPPQPVSIDIGLHVGNGVSPDAADDTGDAPHRPNAYVIGIPRDDSVAPERWNA
jgi:hypothetical protein